MAFWFPIFIVGVIGFFANFGFALAGLGSASPSAKPSPAAAHSMDASPFGGYLPPRAVTAALPSPRDVRLPNAHRGEAQPWEREYGNSRGDRSPMVVTTPGSSSSQPIHINVGMPHGQSALPAPGGFGGFNGASTPLEPNVTALIPREPRAAREVATATAPPAADRPVDRSRIQALIDHLLVFEAACVTRADGGLVPAGEMIARYLLWAGERAIAPLAFETMFAEVTGIERIEFGGVPHYRGVTLRGEPELAVAS